MNVKRDFKPSATVTEVLELREGDNLKLFKKGYSGWELYFATVAQIHVTSDDDVVVELLAVKNEYSNVKFERILLGENNQKEFAISEWDGDLDWINIKSDITKSLDESIKDKEAELGKAKQTKVEVLKLMDKVDKDIKVREKAKEEAKTKETAQ